MLNKSETDPESIQVINVFFEANRLTVHIIWNYLSDDARWRGLTRCLNTEVCVSNVIY